MSWPASTTWMRVPRRAVARWIVPVYALLAVALVPWVVWLAWNLPERSVSAHYRLGWVGFDVLLGGALARTAWLAWRRSPFVVNVASATAALLVVDAWFDVTTSPGGEDLLVSAASALGVELPLAVFSLVIAARAQMQIARSGALVARPRLWRWVSPGAFPAPDAAGVVKPAAANPPPRGDRSIPSGRGSGQDVAPEALIGGEPLAAPHAVAEASVNPAPVHVVRPSA